MNRLQEKRKSKKADDCVTNYNRLRSGRVGERFSEDLKPKIAVSASDKTKSLCRPSEQAFHYTDLRDCYYFCANFSDNLKAAVP